MNHLETTHTLLTSIMASHQRVVLWASGGKDSLVLMHLCRPWAERLVLVHNDMDGHWPGVPEHLQQCAEAWGFRAPVIAPAPMPYEEYVRRFGWPVDVVPTQMDGVLPTPYAEGLRVSSWWHCTIMRCITPLIQASVLQQAEAVLTGSRGSDAPFFAQQGAVAAPTSDMPFARYNPLIEWTDEQVWAYIETHGLTLPPHYGWKRDATDEVPDCMNCTWKIEHWQRLKEHYPEYYAEHWPTVKPVFAALREAMQRAADGLARLEDLGA